MFSAHEVDEDAVELDIRSAPEIIDHDDIGTPGILIQEAPRADIAWSVVMTSGLDASSLFVEGKVELPVETFKIVTPIAGVRIVNPSTRSMWTGGPPPTADRIATIRGTSRVQLRGRTVAAGSE